MDWFKDSETISLHDAHVNAARFLWQDNHPGEPINLTQALDEYCTKLGLPEGFFRIKKKLSISENIRMINSQKIICPDCKFPVKFELLTQCPKANKEGYTGTFYCLNCVWHTLVSDTPIQIKNKVLSGRFSEIKQRTAGGKTEINTELSHWLRCEKCQGEMLFSLVGKNKKGFKNIFYCRKSTCPNHFYTKESVEKLKKMSRRRIAPARFIPLMPSGEKL